MWRVALVVAVIGCGSSSSTPCKDPAACPRPDEIVLQQLAPFQGDLLLELGDTTGALAIYQRGYDRVLSARGDRDPALADWIDRLAAARRAQGKLRDALRLHDRSLGVHGTALSLVERAKTNLEAGEIAAARSDLARAGREVPAQAVRLAVDAAAGDRDAIRQVEAIDIAPLAPTEPLTVSRAIALARRVRQLVAAGQLDTARTLAREMHARLLPDRNPSMAAEVGAALLAVGDRTVAADVLGTAAAALGNEPSRTALRVFTALARASDTQSAPAARAAIALYQAMPALDRAEHDEMWIISRR